MGPRLAGCLLLLSTATASDFAFPNFSSFQGPSLPRSGRRTGGPIAPCPDMAAWCEEAEDYPVTVTVEEQVAAVDFVKARIFGDVSPPSDGAFVIGQTASSTSQPDLNMRFGDYTDDAGFVQESRACDHRKSTVYPKKARNVDGAFVFIVNDEEYKQAVDIEQCMGEGEECRNQEDAPTFGSTVCRQKYTTYKLYVINQDDEQVYDTFSLPSACICHHRSNFAIRGLLGGGEGALELPKCPKAARLALPTASLPPTAFAHAFSSTTTSSSTSSTTRPPRRSTASSAIHFGERRRRRRRQARLQAQGCNTNENFCEDEGDYPDTEVLTAIRRHPAMTDSLFQQLFDSQCTEPQIATRIFNIDEEQLCHGEKNIIFPRKAKNLRDEWRFVVNIGNYTQSVEVEECSNQTISGEFGREIQDENDFGVCLYSGSEGNDPDTTVCRQLYTEHKLLSLSSDNLLKVDSFKLPSACACFVREDFQLEFRDAMTAEGAEVEGDGDPTLPPLPTLPDQVEAATGAPFAFAG